MRSEDEQAIDILSRCNALTVHLRRLVKYNVRQIGDSSHQVLETSPPLASAAFQFDSGIALLQPGHDWQPSGSVEGYLDVSYEMIVTVKDVTGFKMEESAVRDLEVLLLDDGKRGRPVLKKAVDIVTSQDEHLPDYNSACSG